MVAGYVCIIHLEDTIYTDMSTPLNPLFIFTSPVHFHSPCTRSFCPLSIFAKYISPSGRSVQGR